MTPGAKAMTIRLPAAMLLILLMSISLSTCLPGWRIDDPVNQPKPPRR
jgi:hypothetical protein